MLDIFSRFDDRNRILFGLFPLVWLVVFIFVCGIILKFWGRHGKLRRVLSFIMFIAEDLVVRTQGKNIGGAVVVSVSLIFIIVIMNLLGLVPYVFRLTRHLSINLSISIPIWLGVVLISMSYDLSAFLAHLQPLGSPAPLNPFLCVIELVRLLVRPITLSVRLTANLRTGHILMGLLGVGFVSQSVAGGFIIFAVGIFYFIFEIAVCLIQAYIFTLLPTLYADEHPEA